MSSISLNTTTASSGSGIDVTSVVDQIIYAEQAPERIWQQQQATLAAQLGVLNGLKAGFQALQDKVASLRDISGSLNTLTATSSQPSLLTAAALPGSPAGMHRLVVQNLAKVSSYYTDPVAGSDTILAAGTITLQAGSTSHDITIDDSNNTLGKLASYINAQDFGVQATVISDGNGARLALVSKTSGAAGDLNISANTSGLIFHKAVTGTDANFTMDDVPLTAASNTVTSVLPGVTFNLLGESPNAPITLTIAPNIDSAKQAVNDFVSAYNSLVTTINAQFKTGNSSQMGSLSGNSSLRSLQSSLLSNATYSITGNDGYVNLASLGIDMADDGTLSVNSDKLSTALNTNFADVHSFFQGTDGFANHFYSALNKLNDPTEGVIALNLSENSTNTKMLTDQIADFEDRLVARRQFLTDQYSRVDAMLRQYPLLLQQITQQLGTTSGK